MSLNLWCLELYIFQPWLLSKATNLHMGLLVQIVEFHLENITKDYLKIYSLISM